MIDLLIKKAINENLNTGNEVHINIYGVIGEDYGDKNYKTICEVRDAFISVDNESIEFYSITGLDMDTEEEIIGSCTYSEIKKFIEEAACIDFDYISR